MRKIGLAVICIVILAAGAGIIGVNSMGSKSIVDKINADVSAEEFENIVAKNQKHINDPYYSTGLWKLMDDRNYCPIHYAAAAGDAEKVEILLKYGADPNLKDPTVQYTPLTFALKSGQANRFKVAGILIDGGADVFADESGDIFSNATIITENDSQQTISEGTDFVKNLIDITDYRNHQNEFSPVIVGAATYGNNELIHYLIDNGINTVNQADADGITPLMGSVMTNRTDTCRLLLDLGADKTLKSSSGETAYDYAVMYGYDEIAELCKI